MQHRTAALFDANRAARIHRPQVAKWTPRVEGTPEEALKAQEKIRALQTANR